MLSNSLILFFSSFFSGIAVILYPKISKKNFAVLLSFSGSYLFAITVIHILPELFHDAENMTLLGSFVLIGFFLQMILEYFSSGIGHGHVHHKNNHKHDAHHPISNKGNIAISMLVSLGIHAFLEGTLIISPVHHEIAHHHHQANTLMYGLLMHKIPEAIALSAVLAFSFQHRAKAIIWLFVFSLASPLGLILSDLFFSNHWIEQSFFVALFAIVAGNFLFISTTIFFESSPDHQLKFHKLVVASGGALLAILAEILFS